MPAYVIAEFGTPEAAQQAVARLKRTGFGRFGERVLVDTGKCEPLVGDWTPERIVVLEFPSLEAAHAWWDSRERSAPAQLKPVSRKLILVNGA